MYQNQQTRQQEYHQQTTRSPLSSPLSTKLRKFCNFEQRPQKQNYQDHDSPHHHRKQKARHHFPCRGLIFVIFLSVIKDSLTTTYSTLYSSSAVDATTTAPQTNLLPYFDFDVARNITVTVGQTGFLHCRVERLGDKDVSWIRKRDLHILTAGSTTYTSDQRFQVLRPENSGNWTLQIKYPQLRDSGIYECQINTEPKMSLSYTFNVVELKATIIGPTDLYVKSGSDINLTCKIMQGPHELSNIFWYKGFEIIDMTTNQNEIDSGTRITVESDWSAGLTSRLKIRRASSSDTGNYTCVPTIAKSSSVYVHVIIGEHPAAMQHNSSNTHCGNFYISICCMLFTILTCCLQHLVSANINSSSTVNITIPKAKTSSSSGALSLSMASTTAAFQSPSPFPSASVLVSVSLSVSASTSKDTTTKNKTTIDVTPSVTTCTIAQSEQWILSLASFAAYTTTIATLVLFYIRVEPSTTAAEGARAVAATTCEKTRLSVCNSKITR